jgi:ABC-type polysaccharide/polyol phosphate transport system ATPase subunit
MAAALEFENVSKHYRGARSYRMLRDDLTRLLPGRRREPRDTVHALEDVNFEIREGESFAIIGRNGAGKTTALKLATRIAFPTTGKLRVRGRVGALIEVSTGLHPELTGRENVLLYGRILGLKKSDVRRRFDEIVDFAEIGRALEQPVKQYSTGMQLRLGFSLAAHLEPDVLLVDEAIAVGDAGFQHRCVERMGQLVREGRTLGFVSHDMSAVEALCDRAILLQSGRIVADGEARDVVRTYLKAVESELASRSAEPITASGPLEITSVTFHDGAGREARTIAPADQLVVRVHFRAAMPVQDPIFEIGITDGRSGALALASMLVDGQTPGTLSGDGFVDCRFEPLPLVPRTYEVWGGVRTESGVGELVQWQRFGVFELAGEIEESGKGAVSQLMTKAPVRAPYSWQVRGRRPAG